MVNLPAVTDAIAAGRLINLRAIPIFAELDDDGLRRILECATEFEAPAGHVLAEAKMAGAGLFVIEEGSVVVDVPGHPYEMGRGEFFGELSLLTPNAVRAARVRAKTRTRCLAISRHDFERTLVAEPRLAISMLRALAQRIVDRSI